MKPTRALSLATIALNFRTEYAEVKERARAMGELLQGTPGTLVERIVHGEAYWYRRYYDASGKQVEAYVGKATEGANQPVQTMRDRIAEAAWLEDQVRTLRRLGFQVADKNTARLFVSLHNQGLLSMHGRSLEALVLVGTLAFMCMLNDYGVRLTAARTQDVDLAVHMPTKRVKPLLATPQAWMDRLHQSGLQFLEVPGLSARTPSTSVKLAGVNGLRLDLLAHGVLGEKIPISSLDWYAQGIPHLDYLIEQPLESALLAGGTCIPLNIPQPGRLVCHKFFSSYQANRAPEKAAKDRYQARILSACLLREDTQLLERAVAQAPKALKRVAGQALDEVFAQGFLQQFWPDS